MEPKLVSLELAGRPFSIEVGKVARQAGGAAFVRYGDTVVLVTATAAPTAREGVDFLPLTVDYQEKTFAAGKIPGGFFKREGKPSEKEVLTSRLIDRPIRPMFPSGYNDEVQIMNFVLASDRQTDGDVLAMNGASAALCISPLPFQGPLGAVRLGLIDGRFVPFPTHDELEVSELDLIVSGSRDAILMIEGFARELREDRMAEALAEARESGNPHGVDERRPQPLDVEGEERERERRDRALLDPVLREPGRQRRGDHREPETRRDAQEECGDRRCLDVRPDAVGKSLAPMHARILRPAPRSTTAAGAAHHSTDVESRLCRSYSVRCRR